MPALKKQQKNNSYQVMLRQIYGGWYVHQLFFQSCKFISAQRGGVSLNI